MQSLSGDEPDHGPLQILGCSTGFAGFGYNLNCCLMIPEI